MARLSFNLSNKTLRRLGVLIVVVSFLLILGSGFLWFRSYRQYDVMGCSNDTYNLRFTAYRSRFIFEYTRNYSYPDWVTNHTLIPATTGSNWQFFAYRQNPQNRPYLFKDVPWLGIIAVDEKFVESTIPPSYIPLGTAVVIPVPLVIALLGAAGYAGLLLYRKHRFPKSCCRACGYDLRGSPSQGPCPECGASSSK